MSRIKIFAFPYAVGNANVFYEWSKNVETEFEIIPYEYPGHGARFMEPLLNRIEEMALEAYVSMKEQLEEAYCLLGYSMGSLVCYELLKVIEKEKKRLPEAVFFLASEPPGTEPEFTECENMTVEQVKELLTQMGGTPEEILECEEMMKLMKQIVVNDYSAIEHYKADTEIPTISCAAVVVRGSNEVYPQKEMEDWKKLYGEKMIFHELNGGHFFLFEEFENQEKMLNIIQTTIERNEVKQ